MIPLNVWEHQNAIKTLYAKCVGEICTKHGITRMELDILLFLANNPRYDTATDIIEIRYLSKSQVSASVKLLEKRGFLRREYTKGNRKTAHLKICAAALEIIHHGQKAQEQFVSILFSGFSPADIEGIKAYNDRVWKNVYSYLKNQ